jgi:hypothetical protein
MVESYSVTSLKMKRIPLICGPGMAVTQREKRRALRASAADGWAGPLRGAREKEELGSRLLS